RTLTNIERQYPQDPVRRFRCANEGDTFIVLNGSNGYSWSGLSEEILKNLKDFNAKGERFNDVALFGKDKAVLIRGDNGYWTRNVPDEWSDSLEKIRKNSWKITQVMEGTGDDGKSGFVALIGLNGYSWNNAPSDMVDEWKKILDRKATIRCFGMLDKGWV